MKKITLNGKYGKGKFATVDDDDYDEINKIKWFVEHHGKTFYARKDSANERTIFMHRVINRTPFGVETDHINRNGLDNRKCNLRNCTRSENNMNTSLRKNNTSGYRGVVKHSSRNGWIAQIRLNNKYIYVGYFKSPKEASVAYCKKSKELFKDFYPADMKEAR